MGRLLRWAAAVLAITGIARLIRGRRRASDDTTEGVAPADPAAELRQKLAETRDAPPGAGDAPASSSVDEAGSESLEERRARIHEKAQQAIDEMNAEDG